jgi:MFS transporter, SP family, solute carrier family 2 (myo-inositol transporter), member 13
MPSEEKAMTEKLEDIQAQLDKTHIVDEDTLKETRPSTRIWLICVAVSGIDGLLFGFDTAVLNCVFISIGKDLDHTLASGDKELLTFITSAGASVAARFRAS